MSTLNRWTPLALAAGLAVAQSLDAQEAAQPRTHTVVRGDNLWDLSQRYLGNPFLWPEIYRLNRDVVEDPHWIYPGEILRLPGEGPTVIAEQPPGAEVPPGEQQPTVEQPVNPNSPTVFTRRARGVSSSPSGFGDAVGMVPTVPQPTVRSGEVIAAPYVDREGGPRGFGRILKSGDLTGVAEVTDRYRFQAYDRVFIAPPVGHVAPEGERYLAVRLGPVIEDQGQIIIPTGIVEVTKAPRADYAAVAKVVKAFDEISTEDRLIPLDTAGIGTTVRPVRVADGPSTTIRWIAGEPVLPSIQNFIVLAVSSANGVRMGDEFLIYRPSPEPVDGQLRDPEIPIAKAQVVRSTPYGVTAVLLGQEQPAIKEGMSARITARMP
ncbi:MAG TPA: LysM peptidoglycan-binding domain-containing protein [Gemmatimonadaceae bacterium]|nr:LysM peptidoglycan-binding domain-containing protein [Gemmatimonadaceae bacterium]